MRRTVAAIVSLTTLAAFLSYWLLTPGTTAKVRKVVAQVTPVRTPDILFEHMAVVHARHKVMLVQIRRERARAHRLVVARRLAKAKAAAALQAAIAEATPTASPASIPSPVQGGPSPQSIVAGLLNSVQAACLGNIFTRESGWNVYATNPASGAYGIPQALPGDKMASAGADWRTSARTQIIWAIGYVNTRYGSACLAWAYWQVNGNY